MYDVYDRSCRSRSVLSLIADKWAILVIGQLARGTHRFSDLRSAVGGISQRMLTQTLRTLERRGLVHRTVFPQRPPRVEYALTPLGRTLRTPLRAITDWSEHHADEVSS